MNSLIALKDELLNVFATQMHATKDLHNTLEQEYKILNANDVAAFENIVKQKQLCAANLEQNEKLLFALLAKHGFNNSNEGLKQLLAQTENDSAFRALHEAWSELLKSTLECNQQNIINARVINLASVNVRRTLKILSGQSDQAETYAQDGKSVDGSGNQSITIA